MAYEPTAPTASPGAPNSAPLRVTVEIKFHEGPAAGQRRFRLSRQLELPPRLLFDGPLPLEGQCRGEATYALPGEAPVTCRALLHHDPEHPEQGSSAELADLELEELQALQTYIEQRMQPQ
jgi:hypothetical protein